MLKAPEKEQRQYVFDKLSYTRKEAAISTGVSQNCINQAVSTGELPATKKGRNWIILAKDLERWLRD
jgi:excisionase family DNA binding protein